MNESTSINKPFMNKWQALLDLLKSTEAIAVACSGGLDSRLLSYAAHLSCEKYKILHISGVHIPKEEEEILSLFSQTLGIAIDDVAFNPLELKDVKNNSLRRCYYCKKALFSTMIEHSAGYRLCDGSNLDDLTVYRPGMQALKELEVFSPYIEIGITKAEIYEIAKEVHLPQFSQPSQACLLTRFNYNIIIDEEDLIFIDKAESILKAIIPYPFRLRGVKKGQYELHIEAEKEDIDLTQQLEVILTELVACSPAIPIIYMPSLRSYFDNQMGM